MPVPGTDDRARRQGQLDALHVLAGEGFADPKPLFGVSALGDVVEENGDSPLGGIADADGANVEPAFERFGIVLEIGRLTGLGDVAIGFEPELLQVRRELGDPFAAQVYAGLALERRIGLEEAVIHGIVVGIELDLNDGECRLDGLQNGAEAFLTLAQGSLGGAHARQVEHRANHPHGLAVNVTNHMTAVEDIRVGPIQTAKAVLVGPGHLAAIDDRMDRPVNTCTVIRMDMRQPPVT